MQNFLFVRLLLCLTFNCLFLISLSGQARDFISPMQRSLLLSGNFGELRATHFHSGIDLRTGGVTGVPVMCVKDGVIARVRVSPVGYGLALYVEHEDGTTTVYGHLERFVPQVGDLVRKLQYANESFELDENLKEYNLKFKQGDIIAYSGNSGSSGGPHLHFEIRDTKSERALNPLNYYKIKDMLPPKIKMVYIYGIAETGKVEMIRQVAVKAVSPGRYSGGQITIPAGNVGIGVFAEDNMNDSGNKLGVYKLDVVAAKDTVFRMKMDSCAFEQSCYINEIKDFHRYKKRETVYRCFGNYQCQVICMENKECGVIRLSRDSSVAVTVNVADINGNRSEVKFVLKGGVKQKETELPDSCVLRFDQAYQLELPNCQLKIDSGALLYSVEKVLKMKKDSVSGRTVFIFSETDIPLSKKAQLTLTGNFSDKTVICETNAQGRMYPLATFRSESGISAAVGCLNSYTTTEDLIAPSITYLGVSPDRQVKFKIKDNFTGIAEYRGEVNGDWCLFVYDAKNSLFSCSLNEFVFKKGMMNEVKVTVRDRVGNERVLIVDVKN